MLLSISNDYLTDFHVAREANRALVTAGYRMAGWETRLKWGRDRRLRVSLDQTLNDFTELS